MTVYMPSTDLEEEIWRFIRSRHTFTRAEVGMFCSASGSKQIKYLQHLISLGLVRQIARHGRLQTLTAQNPDSFSGDTSAIEDSAQFAQQRSKELNATLTAAQMVDTPQQVWEPETDEDKELWDFVRQQTRFTRDFVLAQKIAPANKTKLFLRKLTFSGLLRTAGCEDKIPYFTALSPLELMNRSQDKRLTNEGRIWTAMRTAGSFTIEDLLMTFTGLEDGFSEARIRRYCGVLETAGYLKDARRGRAKQQPVRYQLIRNTGPLPPTVKRTPVVIDHNIGKVVHVQGEEPTWATA